jgi:hypothetical protein
MATTESYYIQDTVTSDILLNDGTWARDDDASNAKTFSDRSSAVAHVDTLVNGTYRIYSRIAKTD